MSLQCLMCIPDLVNRRKAPGKKNSHLSQKCYAEKAFGGCANMQSRKKPYGYDFNCLV